MGSSNHIPLSNGRSLRLGELVSMYERIVIDTNIINVSGRDGLSFDSRAYNAQMYDCIKNGEPFVCTPNVYREFSNRFLDNHRASESTILHRLSAGLNHRRFKDAKVRLKFSQHSKKELVDFRKQFGELKRAVRGICCDDDYDLNVALRLGKEWFSEAVKSGIIHEDHRFPNTDLIVATYGLALGSKYYTAIISRDFGLLNFANKLRHCFEQKTHEFPFSSFCQLDLYVLDGKASLGVFKEWQRQSF